MCVIVYCVADGIGPIVETTQNHTDEVEERLDELGVLDPATRQAVINAHLALNLNCSVVCCVHCFARTRVRERERERYAYHFNALIDLN